MKRKRIPRAGGKVEKTRPRGESAAGAMAEFRDRVWKLVEPVCEAEGIELVHIEYQTESAGRILRCYIDRPGGVTLDDCVDISRQISDLLDVYTDHESRYRLEVSSPGLERPLGRRSDYNRFKGKEVKIRTAEALAGQKNFTGILGGIQDDEVLLERENTTVRIPVQKITKAILINNDGVGECISQI